MTDSTVVYTDLTDSHEAGTYLGTEILNSFRGHHPDALLLFASSRYDYTTLIKAIDAACQPGLLVGCSSAGEFISQVQGEGTACAVALRSSTMRFAAGVGRGLREDPNEVARQIISAFQGVDRSGYLYRSALVLTDPLAGSADTLIEELNLLAGGSYQFFGGGAGDDARFSQTHIFYGTEAIPNAAVALEILSNKPLGIGVSHGWAPTSEPMRVTEVEGMRLISLNAVPAAEMFQAHAAKSGQQFDREDPFPFFLHNVLGIDTGSGYTLRVPLVLHPDGSITCAAEIPLHSLVCIMGATIHSATEAAAQAIDTALHQLDGHRPAVALFFDCVATRLRMGKEFGLEMQALQKGLGQTRYAGCNTYGQIVRTDGQFNGFHNCTAVVCVLPE